MAHRSPWQSDAVQVDLVDGTYELFRYHFSPGGGHVNGLGEQVGAVRGVLRSVVSLLEAGATHIAVATDHVVESFRNEMFDGYKTGEGIDPELFAQFPLLEDALEALGVAVLPMVDVEADDGLASAAAVAVADGRPSRIVIRTPDK
ncbi:MAG: flap endonuclease, partial [Actinomycetes bacterium]